MLKHKYKYFKKLYDENYKKVSFDKNSVQRNDRFRRIGKFITNGDRVLDFGGGDGELQKYIPKVDYSILDISDEHSFKKKQRVGLEGEVYIQSDNHSYDVVIMSEVLEHIPNCYETLGEVNRILVKDGLLIITVPNPFSVQHIVKSFLGLYQDPSKEHLYWFDWSYLSNLLLASGFDLVSKSSFCFFPSRFYQKIYFVDKLFSKIFSNNCAQILCVFKKNN